MDTILPPPPPVLLPISGSPVGFPVRRVYCVGRNYAAHAIEMGHDPDREPPFFFQKNPDNLLLPGEDFPYPPLSSDVHHEVELIVALRSGGADIPVAVATDHVFGYGVGIDFTRRDLQAEAKKPGSPGPQPRPSSTPLRFRKSCQPRQSAIRRTGTSGSRSMASCVSTATLIR